MRSGDNRQQTGLFKSYEHYPKTTKTFLATKITYLSATQIKYLLATQSQT